LSSMAEPIQLDPNEKNVENFLTQIMRIDSTSRNEETLCVALTRYFESIGWYVIRQPLKSDPKRHNLLITRVPYVAPGPRYVMNTHMDTVPPFIEPVNDGFTIRGRGSNDAKGQLAAMVFAIRRIENEYKELANDVGLLLVVNEEVDHIGMMEANSLGLVPEYLMVGEPTELKFGRLQKGAVKVTLKVHGKAAHSGYPHMGESAIDKLLDILQDIRSHKWPADEFFGQTTVNIGLISGGQALNALAENASASMFFRVTTSTADILHQLNEIVAGRAEIDRSYGENEPIRLTEPPSPYESSVVSFNTDLPYFIARNKLKGAFLFGAGSITNAHSADEHILIDDLKKCVDIHVDICVRTLVGH
uniref:M20_dimer domain-containing protein n=1 Tax=Anisakis simplex TaxID=6269 RepID=A0A0M3K2L8_ANISI